MSTPRQPVDTGSCYNFFDEDGQGAASTALVFINYFQIFLMVILNGYGYYKVFSAQRLWERQGGQADSRPSSLLLPIYRWLMWFMCGCLLAASLIQHLIPFSITHNNDMGSSFVYGVTFFMKQVSYELVTFALMSPGAGKRTYMRSLQLALCWGLITLGVKFLAAYLAVRQDSLSVFLEFSWGLAVLVFYLVIWLWPDNALIFRRPAAIPYARFWVVVYSLYVLWMCLRIRLVDAGYCVYIAHSLVIIVLAPWAVYRACCEDSFYWQGAAAITTSAPQPRSIASVLGGFLSPSLAADISQADAFHVPLINFAALTIDEKTIPPENAYRAALPDGSPPFSQPATATDSGSPLPSRWAVHTALQTRLSTRMATRTQGTRTQGTRPAARASVAVGSAAAAGQLMVLDHGSMARVYRGRYRGHPVAIKLLYAPELTKELVENLFEEASVMCSISHSHVTQVLGVCVMPPAVALVMELCVSSLHHSIHKPNGVDAYRAWGRWLGRIMAVRGRPVADGDRDDNTFDYVSARAAPDFSRTGRGTCRLPVLTEAPSTLERATEVEVEEEVVEAGMDADSDRQPLMRSRHTLTNSRTRARTTTHAHATSTAMGVDAQYAVAEDARLAAACKASQTSVSIAAEDAGAAWPGATAALPSEWRGPNAYDGCSNGNGDLATGLSSSPARPRTPAACCAADAVLPARLYDIPPSLAVLHASGLDAAVLRQLAAYVPPAVDGPPNPAACVCGAPPESDESSDDSADEGACFCRESSRAAVRRALLPRGARKLCRQHACVCGSRGELPATPAHTMFRVAIDVLTAVSTLHAQPMPIAHLDIKSGNFLVGRDGVVKVADLELSARLPHVEAVIAPSLRPRAAHSSDVEDEEDANVWGQGVGATVAGRASMHRCSEQCSWRRLAALACAPAEDEASGGCHVPCHGHAAGSGGDSCESPACRGAALARQVQLQTSMDANAAATRSHTTATAASASTVSASTSASEPCKREREPFSLCRTARKSVHFCASVAGGGGATKAKLAKTGTEADAEVETNMAAGRPVLIPQTPTPMTITTTTTADTADATAALAALPAPVVPGPSAAELRQAVLGADDILLARAPSPASTTATATTSDPVVAAGEREDADTDAASMSEASTSEHASPRHTLRGVSVVCPALAKCECCGHADAGDLPPTTFALPAPMPLLHGRPSACVCSFEHDYFQCHAHNAFTYDNYPMHRVADARASAAMKRALAQVLEGPLRTFQQRKERELERAREREGDRLFGIKHRRRSWHSAFSSSTVAASPTSRRQVSLRTGREERARDSTAVPVAVSVTEREEGDDRDDSAVAADVEHVVMEVDAVGAEEVEGEQDLHDRTRSEDGAEALAAHVYHGGVQIAAGLVWRPQVPLDLRTAEDEEREEEEEEARTTRLRTRVSSVLGTLFSGGGEEREREKDREREPEEGPRRDDLHMLTDASASAARSVGITVEVEVDESSADATHMPLPPPSAPPSPLPVVSAPASTQASTAQPTPSLTPAASPAPISAHAPGPASLPPALEARPHTPLAFCLVPALPLSSSLPSTRPPSASLPLPLSASLPGSSHTRTAVYADAHALADIDVHMATDTSPLSGPGFRAGATSAGAGIGADASPAPHLHDLHSIHSLPSLAPLTPAPSSPAFHSSPSPTHTHTHASSRAHAHVHLQPEPIGSLCASVEAISAPTLAACDGLTFRAPVALGPGHPPLLIRAPSPVLARTPSPMPPLTAPSPSHAHAHAHSHALAHVHSAPARVSSAPRTRPPSTGLGRPASTVTITASTSASASAAPHPHALTATHTAPHVSHLPAPDSMRRLDMVSMGVCSLYEQDARALNLALIDATSAREPLLRELRRREEVAALLARARPQVQDPADGGDTLAPRVPRASRTVSVDTAAAADAAVAPRITSNAGQGAAVTADTTTTEASTGGGAGSAAGGIEMVPLSTTNVTSTDDAPAHVALTIVSAPPQAATPPQSHTRAAAADAHSPFSQLRPSVSRPASPSASPSTTRAHTHALPDDADVRMNTSPEDPLGVCPDVHIGWGLTVRHGMLAHHALHGVFARLAEDWALAAAQAVAHPAGPHFMLSEGDYLPLDAIPIVRSRSANHTNATTSGSEHSGSLRLLRVPSTQAAPSSPAHTFAHVHGTGHSFASLPVRPGTLTASAFTPITAAASTSASSSTSVASAGKPPLAPASSPLPHSTIATAAAIASGGASPTHSTASSSCSSAVTATALPSPAADTAHATHGHAQVQTAQSIASFCSDGGDRADCHDHSLVNSTSADAGLDALASKARSGLFSSLSSPALHCLDATAHARVPPTHTEARLDTPPPSATALAAFPGSAPSPPAAVVRRAPRPARAPALSALSRDTDAAMEAPHAPSAPQLLPGAPAHIHAQVHTHTLAPVPSFASTSSFATAFPPSPAAPSPCPELSSAALSSGTHTSSSSHSHSHAQFPHALSALEPQEPPRSRRPIDPAATVSGPTRAPQLPAPAPPAVHVRGVPIPLRACAAEGYSLTMADAVCSKGLLMVLSADEQHAEPVAEGTADDQLNHVQLPQDAQHARYADNADTAAQCDGATDSPPQRDHTSGDQPPASRPAPSAWMLPACALTLDPTVLLSDDPAAAADPVLGLDAQRGDFGCCGIAVGGGVGLQQDDGALVAERQKRRAQRLNGLRDRDRVKRLKQRAAAEAGERDKWGFAYKDTVVVPTWHDADGPCAGRAVFLSGLSASSTGESDLARSQRSLSVRYELERCQSRSDRCQSRSERERRANDVISRPPGWFLFQYPRAAATRRCCYMSRPDNRKGSVAPLVVPQCVYWLAPEAIRAEPIGVKADVYSTACVLWELTHRRVPYRDLEALFRADCRRDTIAYGHACDDHYIRTGRSPPPGFLEHLCVPAEERLARAIAWAHYRPHFNATVPPALRGIIKRMWHPDPQARPHAALALLWVRVAYARFCARMDVPLAGRRAGDWYLWEHTVREAAWQRIDVHALEAQVAAMEEEEERLERAARRMERCRKGLSGGDDVEDEGVWEDEYGFSNYGCCCGCDTATIAVGGSVPGHSGACV